MITYSSEDYPEGKILRAKVRNIQRNVKFIVSTAWNPVINLYETKAWKYQNWLFMLNFFRPAVIEGLSKTFEEAEVKHKKVAELCEDIQYNSPEWHRIIMRISYKGNS